MKPYAMVLPSTALFGSSFGSMFLKTIGSSNASLLLILVFAFVITYSIGYLFMRRPQMSCDSERMSAPGDERAKVKEKSSADGATSAGGDKDETTPLLDDSGEEEEEDDYEGEEGLEDEEEEGDVEGEEDASVSQTALNEGEY